MVGAKTSAPRGALRLGCRLTPLQSLVTQLIVNQSLTLLLIPGPQTSPRMLRPRHGHQVKAGMMSVDTIAARISLFRRRLRALSPTWSTGPASCGDSTTVADVRMVNSGARLLLRMEYLLASGRDADVSVTAASRTTTAAWEARFGGAYAEWQAAAWLAQLAQGGDPLWRAALGVGRRSRAGVVAAVAAAGMQAAALGSDQGSEDRSCCPACSCWLGEANPTFILLLCPAIPFCGAVFAFTLRVHPLALCPACGTNSCVVRFQAIRLLPSWCSAACNQPHRWQGMWLWHVRPAVTADSLTAQHLAARSYQAGVDARLARRRAEGLTWTGSRGRHASPHPFKVC